MMKKKQLDFEHLLRELSQAELKYVLIQGNYKIDSKKIAHQWLKQVCIPHHEPCLQD